MNGVVVSLVQGSEEFDGVVEQVNGQTKMYEFAYRAA